MNKIDLVKRSIEKALRDIERLSIPEVDHWKDVSDHLNVAFDEAEESFFHIDVIERWLEEDEGVLEEEISRALYSLEKIWDKVVPMRLGKVTWVLNKLRYIEDELPFDYKKAYFQAEKSVEDASKAVTDLADDLWESESSYRKAERYI